MNPIVKNNNKLRWEFENVSNLTDAGMFSDKFSIDGVDWKLKICTGTQTDKSLQVYLYYCSDNEKNKNWICETSANTKLLNQCGKAKHLERKWKFCMQSISSNRGFTKMIEWDKLILPKNGYVEDDSIVIEIEFDFKYYDYSRKIPGFTDTTITIEKTDFHLNKGVLCSKSEHLYCLLVHKKNEFIPVELKDIKATDFCYLLASFDPYFDSVYEDNYMGLIKAAKKFGVLSLHQACEQFLLADTMKMKLIDKIKFADESGYEKLMKSCVESLKTGDDIKNLHGNVKFSELKETTKLRIMQRFLDIY